MSSSSLKSQLSKEASIAGDDRPGPVGLVPEQTKPEQVVWEDPPGPTGGRRDWRSLLIPLTKEPLRWARVADFKVRSTASTYGTFIKTRRLRVPDGQWETTTRQIPNGRIGLYVRYLGPKEPVR